MPSVKQNQRGFVLIMVIILVMLISGLGLMAVRYARQEVSAAGAYADSTQTIALAESAMAMAVSDLKSSPEYYKYQFGHVTPVGTDFWNLRYPIPLDPSRFAEETSVGGGTSYCDANLAPGCIRLLTSTDAPDDLGGKVTDLNRGVAYYTAVTYDTPLVGPCPPGYSCFDDLNYGWYVFGVNVVAMSGPDPLGDFTSLNLWSNKFVPVSRAQGYGRVTIGPIGAYGR